MFTFTPLAPSDRPALRRWLTRPHVRAWWGNPDQRLAEAFALAESDWAEAMIVSWQGRRIGYLQVWDAPSHPSGRWSGMEPGAFGIDFMVGEPSYAGRGLGSALVGAYTDRLLEAGRARLVVCDLGAANRRGFAALARAGFHRADGAGVQAPGTIRMVKDRAHVGQAEGAAARR